MSDLKSQIADLFATQSQTAAEPTTPVAEPIIAPNATVPEPPPAQATEPIPVSVSDDVILEVLKARTNGKITSFDALGQLDEIETLRNRATELEAKSQISPFANPLVEKLNQLYGANADDQTIQLFLQAQALNIDNLTEREKYAEYLVRSVKGVSKSDALEFYDDKYGSESLSASEKIEKAREIQQAEKFLREQKVAAENPEAIRKQAEQRELIERTRATWQQEVRNVASSFERIGGEYEQEGSKLSFAVNLSAEEREAVLPHVLDAIKDMPVNAETRTLARNILEGYALMANRDKILQTIHRDGYAKGREEALKASAGAAPTPINETAPNAVQSDIERFFGANSKLVERLGI